MRDWYDRDNFPPWEIGRPQPVFKDWVNSGFVKGLTADIGCGTGDNTLYLAKNGIEIIGYDLSEIAIKEANEKVKQRNLQNLATFKILSVFELPKENKKFDTVVESGLLHNWEFETKQDQVNVVLDVLNKRGTYLILGMNTDEPLLIGPPNRLKMEELQQLFSQENGWRLDFVKDCEFYSMLEKKIHKAWSVKVTKL